MLSDTTARMRVREADRSSTISFQPAVVWVIVTSSALLSFVQPAASADASWSYDAGAADGPSNWHRLPGYENCNGSSQSPINIELDKATYKSDLGALALTGYDTSSGFVFDLSNNGHTVQLTIESGPEIAISGGGLPERYNLVQFHFHWGSDDSKGSEHLVDSNAYPLEIHFVHYRSSYASIADAADKKDGLAVLGFFAQIGDTANPGLEKLLAKFGDVANEGTEATVDSFALREIVPSNIKDYARYSGSLTTPACFESVIWTVLKEPITITSAQMAKFRNLYETETGAVAPERLVDNFRPAQSLNSRTVYLTFATSSAHLVERLQIPLAVFLAAVVFALASRY